MDHTYLFLLCPPFSGSTVLWQLVGTSENVSALPTEGQFLPEVEKYFRDEPWSRKTRIPWAEVRDVWHGYWDPKKPVLIEKSPTHLIRAGEILEWFHPLSFLVTARNPYAHAEGFIRRQQRTARQAARFVVRCLERQRANLTLTDSTLRLTYEEMVENPDATVAKIERFFPLLGKLDPTATFCVHSVEGRKARKLENFNEKKIALLSNREIEEMNTVFVEAEELLAFWGYSIYRPTVGRSLLRKVSSLISGRVPDNLEAKERAIIEANAPKRLERAERRQQRIVENKKARLLRKKNRAG